MEQILEIFEKGKTIDDFKAVIDSGIRNVWDSFVAKVLIPSYDSSIKKHRYSGLNINKFMRFLIPMRKFYLSEVGFDIYDGIKKYYERIKDFGHPKNITEYMNLEFYRGEKGKQDSIIYEFKGKQKNTHYEYSKMDAMIIGMIGCKITNCVYSSRDLYLRYEIEPTKLLYEEELHLKERKQLIKHNLEFLTNFTRVIRDKDLYLWMKQAEDNDLVVSFKNKKAFDRWIKKIEDDLLKFGDKEEFLLDILHFFEKMHWIRIDNEEELRFHFALPEDKFTDEKCFFYDYISNHAEIIQSDGVYYLKRRNLN